MCISAGRAERAGSGWALVVGSAAFLSASDGPGAATSFRTTAEGHQTDATGKVADGHRAGGRAKGPQDLPRECGGPGMNNTPSLVTHFRSRTPGRGSFQQRRAPVQQIAEKFFAGRGAQHHFVRSSQLFSRAPGQPASFCFFFGRNGLLGSSPMQVVAANVKEPFVDVSGGRVRKKRREASAQATSRFEVLMWVRLWSEVRAIVGMEAHRSLDGC